MLWRRFLLKTKFGYDDTLDAFGCHGIGGTWGGIATGLFATTAVNGDGANGLFYGNASPLLKQLVAIGATYAFTIIMTYAIIKAINFFLPVRVDEHEEHMGLDISMHGEKAYEHAERATKKRCNLSIVDCISFNILSGIYRRSDTGYIFTNKFQNEEDEKYPGINLHKKDDRSPVVFSYLFRSISYILRNINI